MQLVLFNPPRRTKPLEKGHCREHEPRLGVVSRAPLTVGEVMAEKCGAQIVEGEDNGARRRPAAAPPPPRPHRTKAGRGGATGLEKRSARFPGGTSKYPLSFASVLSVVMRRASALASGLRMPRNPEAGSKISLNVSS